MSFDPKVIEALAELRALARSGTGMNAGIAGYFNALDNAGVFAALDEQADYASAEAILAEGAAIDMVRQSNPNVPADKALQVLHSTWHPEREHGVGYTAKARQRLISDALDQDETEQPVPDPEEDGYAAVSRLGKPERVPGTDTLVPAHEHVFRNPHSDEVCYGTEWCTVTYREHRPASVKIGYPVPCSCSQVRSGCTCD
jgi:hypothetical protein